MIFCLWCHINFFVYKVHLFYSYWQSFSTAKSYAWEDTYDLKHAPNRRVQRMMEKDNKKMRDAAKKKRNEAVRVSWKQSGLVSVLMVASFDHCPDSNLWLLSESETKECKLTRYVCFFCFTTASTIAAFTAPYGGERSAEAAKSG